MFYYTYSILTYKFIKMKIIKRIGSMLFDSLSRVYPYVY